MEKVGRGGEDRKNRGKKRVAREEGEDECGEKKKDDLFVFSKL